MSVNVSVIVPVYNVEKYLRTCIESIVHQTYRNFELILVDDGSTDNCPEICDGYCRKYNYIKVIHKKNGGLSEARNVGVESCSGNYVTFIDSDDYVSLYYLETLTDMVIDENVDICVAGLCRFYSNEEINSDTGRKYIKRLTGKKALKRMLYQKDMDTSACGCLFRKEIVEKNKFPVGLYHEDDRTTYKYYTSARSVMLTNRKLYFYLQRDNSIMYTFGQASIDEINAADKLLEECILHYHYCIHAAKSKKFSNYCQVLLSVDNIDNHKELYDKIVNFIKKVKWEMIFNPKVRIKNKVAAFALVFGVKALIALQKFKNR